MKGTELRSFSDFQILTKTTYPDLSRNIQISLILKFAFIQCKIAKVSRNDPIRLWTWFTCVFLMNGTKSRSFRDFQILRKMASPELSRNFENWLILKFIFLECKTRKTQSKMITFNCKHNLHVFSWWMEQI